MSFIIELLVNEFVVTVVAEHIRGLSPLDLGAPGIASTGEKARSPF